MPNSGQPMSMEDILQLASSPLGQQLIQMLRKTHPDTLQQATQKAASGDMDAAKNALSALIQDPEVKKLLEQLGR